MIISAKKKIISNTKVKHAKIRSGRLYANLNINTIHIDTTTYTWVQEPSIVSNYLHTDYSLMTKLPAEKSGSFQHS